LRQECLNAFRDGFSGKMAIHPAQISVINEAFTPSDTAVMQAAAIVEAFKNAGDAGVISLNGRMLDRPHLKLAERILAQVEKPN
jgi:citrate lyase subunit beta / citryl-CoA lyase